MANHLRRFADRPVAFRLPPAEHKQLVAEAEASGLSPGTYARQLVLRGLTDHSTAELLAEMESLRRRVIRLQSDLATAVVAILADAGKATVDEAQAWVDSHLDWQASNR